MTRYEAMFARLTAIQAAALVPFAVLGDPDRERSERWIDRLVDAGADALELGLPFSDPVADGPVIQAAGQRALAAGDTMTGRLASLARIRAGHPELPIGLLVYANLVWRRGVERFYADAAEAGVDSVLVADVPFAESGPFTAAAAATGIAPVLIVPPGASSLLVARIAGRCRGYTYVTTRAGVTGDAGHHDEELAARLTLVGSLGAPPPLLGFGIGSPAQVHQAVAAGAAGVIVGSALVSRAATDPEEAMALFATLHQAARHPPIATFG